MPPAPPRGCARWSRSSNTRRCSPGSATCIPEQPSAPASWARQTAGDDPVDVGTVAQADMGGVHLDMVHMVVNLIDTGLPGDNSVPAAVDGGDRHPDFWQSLLVAGKMILDGIEIHSRLAHPGGKGGVLGATGNRRTQGDHLANQPRLIPCQLPGK